MWLTTYPVDPRPEAAPPFKGHREPGHYLDQNLLRCILGILRMEQHAARRCCRSTPDGVRSNPPASLADRRSASARNKIFILVLARSIASRAKGLSTFIILPPGGSALSTSPQFTRFCGIAEKWQLTISQLPPLFDEHQRGSPMEGQGLPAIPWSLPRTCRRRSRSQRYRCTHGMIGLKKKKGVI